MDIVCMYGFHGAWLYSREQKSGHAFSAAVCEIQARMCYIDISTAKKLVLSRLKVRCTAAS